MNDLQDALNRWDNPSSGALTGDSDLIVEAARLVANRKPIPWCTTHDAPRCASDCIESIEEDHCLATVPGHCEFSTGGPDHKWWQDILRHWVCQVERSALVTEDCIPETGGKPGSLHRNCGWVDVRE